jgi:type IV pilus assembly protein PilX
MKRTVMRPSGAGMASRQRGTMLIISLIILVAMTLAGLAAMRSVDTATIMAGNLALRQSTLNAADQGIQAGYNLLLTPTVNPNANLDDDGMNVGIAGYYSNISAAEPNWADPNAWNNPARQPVTLPTDPAGNVVSYIVERLCTTANSPASAGGQICGVTISTAAASKQGSDNFRAQDALFNNLPQTHYRITARATGPRNAVAIVQAMTR